MEWLVRHRQTEEAENRYAYFLTLPRHISTLPVPVGDRYILSTLAHQ